MDRREFLRTAGLVSGSFLFLRGLPALAVDPTPVGNLNIGPGELLELPPDQNVLLTLSGPSLIEGTLRSHPAPGVSHVIDAGGQPVWVMGAGRLDLQGQPKVAWGRVGADPSWAPTDELWAAPVAPGDYAMKPFALGSPVATWGGQTAEVLNLSRNLVVRNVERIQFGSDENPGEGVAQDIRFVRVESAGVAGEMGPYPIHFHRRYDASRGTVLEGVVVVGGRNHAFVTHASHGITLRDCIAFECQGSNFWWDPPPLDFSQPGSGTDPINDSEDILWERCVAAGGLLEGRETGFYMGSGANLAARGCVATALQGARDSSGFFWSGYAKNGTWDFRDSVSHNNAAKGYFNWQNSNDYHELNTFTVYGNQNQGMLHGAYQNRFRFYDLLVEGNGGAALALWANSEAEDGQLWARSVFRDESVALEIPPALAPGGVTTFTGCSFEAPTPVLFEDGTSHPWLLDFIDCGLSPEDFTIVSMNSSSRIRVQGTDGSAFQITSSGLVTIETFAEPSEGGGTTTTTPSTTTSATTNTTTLPSPLRRPRKRRLRG